MYLVRSDGSGSQDLSSNLANDGQPSWSPDGKQIAFTSTRDLNGEIYVMNADGTAQRRLTATKAINDTAPVWSPDGLELAFMCTDAAPVTQICVARADGMHQLTLTRGAADNLYPVWAPDSRSVLYVSARPGNHGPYAIYSTPIGGGPEHKLTSVGAGDAEPDFSPDGKTIAFISSTSPGRWGLYAMNADVSGRRLVLPMPGRVDGPAWSPDGSRIAFECIGCARKGRSDLYVVRSDGTGLVRLTAGPGNSTTPTWAPDGRLIAFDYLNGARADIAVVQADGKGERTLTSGTGKNGGPAWRP